MNKLIASSSLLVLALLATGSARADSSAGKSYFLDIHELGPGKATAAGVAEAHQKDLAVQGKHGVKFLDYWVDEPRGVVYCLSEAPAAHSVTDTHREAHGLLPTRILPVTSGQAAKAIGGKKLFLDVHELGAGNVSAQAVAEAHQKDLAAQGTYGVNFLNYWVDEANGTVFCLSEAPDAAAVTATHRQAHGLLPAQVIDVSPTK